MTAWMKKLRQSRIVQWLLQSERLPLYFAVTVVTAIMYHYQAVLTPVWLLLSLLLEALLFRLFSFVERHHVLGGLAFLATGIVTLALAIGCITIGENPALTGGVFVPQEAANNIDFYVWFLTPQSVLDAVFFPYTLAIFLLFTFFVGFTTYYFTFVQYRVLMSFAILCFPFTIYAKENENMPVPCIILLFVCYFAVMVFCKQFHAGDADVVHRYVRGKTSYPMAKSEKAAARSKPNPELSDGMAWRGGALFLAGACIVVLLLPKPAVQEDRSHIEGLINMAAFTDLLLDAVGGFDSESDGGVASLLQSNQSLYYAAADQPANLRRATLTNYHYDTDSWTASDYDTPNEEGAWLSSFDTALTQFERRDLAERISSRMRIESAEVLLREMQQSNLSTDSDWQTTYDLYRMVQAAAEASPAFAEKWGLQNLPALDPTPYIQSIILYSVSFNGEVYLVPNQTYWVRSNYRLQQNQSGILYRASPARVYHDQFAALYLSDAIAREPAIQQMMAGRSINDWASLIYEAYEVLPEEFQDVWHAAYWSTLAAEVYDLWVESETPDSVCALAAELTADCTSDYEKACAFQRYLAQGDYIYDLDYVKGQDANVETFLFESKTGVCYQFASAMVELCRAVGIPARYVEGFAMREETNYSNYDYVIQTNHAHAFADVFIAGYGWMMFDATAPDLSAGGGISRASVIGGLQFAGVFLLVAAVLLFAVLCWVLPWLQERFFCRWYAKHRDGEAVQRAFARLRKQWHADPALTARCLCTQMAEQLACDTAPMLAGIEQAVYGGGCSTEVADAAFTCYQALRDAWKRTRKKRRKANA